MPKHFGFFGLVRLEIVLCGSRSHVMPTWIGAAAGISDCGRIQQPCHPHAGMCGSKESMAAAYHCHPSYYDNPTLHIGVRLGRPFRTNNCLSILQVHVAVLRKHNYLPIVIIGGFVPYTRYGTGFSLTLYSVFNGSPILYFLSTNWSTAYCNSWYGKLP